MGKWCSLHISPFRSRLTTGSGAVVGRSVVGFASDKIGRFNSVILVKLVGIVFVFLFLTVRHTIWKFFALAPCWGFTSGAILSMMTALIRELVAPMMHADFC